MKTYDEVFENVMKATDAHHKKVRRIQNAVSVSALCAVCVAGVGMFLKLEKPFSVPSENQLETMTMTTDEMTRMLDTTASAPASSDSSEASNSISRTVETEQKHTSAPQEQENSGIRYTSAIPAGEIVHSGTEMTTATAESGAHTHEIETTTVTTPHSEKSATSTATEKTTTKASSATTAKETVHTTQKTEITTIQTTVTVPETTAVIVQPTELPTEPIELIPSETVCPTEEITEPVTELETESPAETETEPIEPETSETTTTTTATETTFFTSYQPPETVHSEEEEYLTPEEWESRYGTASSDMPESVPVSYTVTVILPDADDNSLMYS